MVNESTLICTFEFFIMHEDEVEDEEKEIQDEKKEDEVDEKKD